MSERLKEIKVKGLWDLELADLRWLIQQAERVEELEKENENLVFDIKHERHYRKLAEEKNQLYKQALEEVLITDEFEDPQDYIDRIVTKASEALEQEK